MCVLCIPDGSTEPVSPLETSPGELCVSLSNFQHLSSNLRSSLSPLASALTGFAPASPLDSALTKNIPGGGGIPSDPFVSTLTLDFQLFSVNSFRLTHFTKNASTNPLVSHTFKTTIRPGMVVQSEHREPKDPSELSKAFRLIHFRKNA